MCRRLQPRPARVERQPTLPSKSNSGAARRRWGADEHPPLLVVTAHGSFDTDRSGREQPRARGEAALAGRCRIQLLRRRRKWYESNVTETSANVLRVNEGCKHVRPGHSQSHVQPFDVQHALIIVVEVLQDTRNDVRCRQAVRLTLAKDQTPSSYTFGSATTHLASHNQLDRSFRRLLAGRVSRKPSLHYVRGGLFFGATKVLPKHYQKFTIEIPRGNPRDAMYLRITKKIYPGLPPPHVHPLNHLVT
jgi:hypothetical protein